MKKLGLILLGVAALAQAGCASKGYQRQEYAKLGNSKVFETEYPRVWKAIVKATEKYKLESMEQEDGELKTDWVYATSTEKYVSYEVNGLPRKKFLQVRYRFEVKAEKQMGGVKVTVESDEEVEKLKSDGSSDGWSSSTEPDTSRQNGLLKSIEQQLLSMPN